MGSAIVADRAADALAMMVAIDVAADLARADDMTAVAGATVVMANDGALMDDGALRRGFGRDADGDEAGECDETGSGDGDQLHDTLLLSAGPPDPGNLCCQTKGVRYGSVLAAEAATNRAVIATLYPADDARAAVSAGSAIAVAAATIAVVATIPAAIATVAAIPAAPATVTVPATIAMPTAVAVPVATAAGAEANSVPAASAPAANIAMIFMSGTPLKTSYIEAMRG